MIHSQAHDMMEKDLISFQTELISIKQNKVKLQTNEPKTPLFPWTQSRAAGLYAIVMIVWSMMMEFVVVKYACYFTGGNDPGFLHLAKYGWGKTNGLTTQSFVESDCKEYDALMKFDYANIRNTLYGIATWSLSNFFADSYQYSAPAILICCILSIMMFAKRHYSIVDAQGNRYWGNTIIFILMTIVSLVIPVIGFVTDGHNNTFPRSIVNQNNRNIHLMAATFVFAGFTAYGILMTISLFVDVMIRGAIKSSVAIWTIIIYGGLCNIGSAYYIYGCACALEEVVNHHHYASEWYFINVTWMYFFTIPMLTMWAEPASN